MAQWFPLGLRTVRGIACRMPLHPVSDYIDVLHTPFPRLFEGVGEVWDVLPRIGPFLKEWLEPSVEGDLHGEVHLEGPVFIGPGVRILHGATILGPVYIGAGSFIGPGCYLRPNTIIGENCIIGNSCELKNCIIGDSAEIPHWNYVGDSIVGHKAHLGAGVILSNWRHDHGGIPVLDERAEGGRILTGLAKFGAVIGDYADLGCHAVLNPGSLIGRRSVIYGGVVWRGVLPADRIVKLRQELDIAERRQ